MVSVLVLKKMVLKKILVSVSKKIVFRKSIGIGIGFKKKMVLEFFVFGLLLSILDFGEPS